MRRELAAIFPWMGGRRGGLLTFSLVCRPCPSVQDRGREVLARKPNLGFAFCFSDETGWSSSRREDLKKKLWKAEGQGGKWDREVWANGGG